MLKGLKILGGCFGAMMLGIFGFIVLSTLVVEAMRSASPGGQDQIRDWMLGTPQPVYGGREKKDNGYVNAGVGVGFENYTHPDDPSEPWGIPFNQKEPLGCEFQDCPNYCRHTGVDFPGEIGTPIFATMAGKVVYVGFNGGWGNLVVVENNGFQTWYAHLDWNSFAVSEGQIISRGQKIGERGHNGNSSGAHLHYGIKKHTGKDRYIWVDPELYFNRSDTIERWCPPW